MQVYIWNVIIGIVITSAFAFWLGWDLGKQKGFDAGCEEFRKYSIKEFDRIFKIDEQKMDIYRDEMLDMKKRYTKLCEDNPAYDPDGEYSGLLTIDVEE